MTDYFPSRAPQILIEALTGDFAGNLDHVSLVAKSGLDVYAHNVETTEEMTPFVRDHRANFRQSLRVLERAKEDGTKVTKTSMMLGVGEDEDGIMRALKGLYRFLGGELQNLIDRVSPPPTVPPFNYFDLQHCVLPAWTWLPSVNTCDLPKGT
jgi:hypothetical protein